jgi:capsid assembly protease
MNRIWLATRLYNAPLAIAPAKLQVICWALKDKLEAELMVYDGEISPEMRAPVKVPTAQPQQQQIAIVDVFGSLVHRARGLDAESGLASYDTIGRQIESLTADPQISGILLRVDSPGGEVDGAFELARTIRESAKLKPIWSLIDGVGLSAGYLLASQTQRILLGTNAKVGSIGIIMIHLDCSAADAKEGLQYNVLSRGAHKADFSPHAPLSKGAEAWAEQLLDHEFGMFVDYVASSRNLSTGKIRDTEASILVESDALKLGLADGQANFNEAIAEFSSSLSTTVTTTKGRSMADVIALPDPAPPPAPVAAPIPAPVPSGPTAADYEAIAALCALAKHPELAATFIAEKRTVIQVRDALMQMASQQDDETDVFSPILASAEATMPAVKKGFLGNLMKAKLGLGAAR